MVMLGLFGVLIGFTLHTPAASAASGTNSQINYQGRLLTNTGAVVPDGNYNMRFKIYQDGAGTAAGDPGGTLKWTESWQNIIGTGSTGPVVVKNGYFSVNLGKWCAFTTSSCQGNSNTVVDWNQDTLWLSVDVDSAGTSVNNTPTYNGEMLPMKRFTSSIYAFNASQLGGLGATNFVQLAQGLQTDASTTQASIAINKTGGTAAILDLQRAGASVLNVSNSGATTITGPSAGSATALTVNTGSGNNAGLVVSSAGQNFDYSYIMAWNTTLGRGVFDVNYLGNTTLRNATDNVYALTVRNVGNATLLGVDTLNGRVSVADSYMCVSPYGLTAAQCPSQLTVQNTQRFVTGYEGGASADYLTPLSATIQGRLLFDNEDTSGYRALIAGGITSSTDNTGRGIIIADARLTTDNQPTIGVLSPDETDIFGLGWDGINTAATLKTLPKTTSSTSGINIFTGGITFGGSSNSTGSITLKTGSAVVNNGSGSIILNTGGVSGSGVGGQVLVKPGTGADRSDFLLVTNAAATSVLTVNTATPAVTIGSATADSTQINLMLDSSNSFSDSGTCTGTLNGALYYSNTANTNSLRTCSDNKWTDIVTAQDLGLTMFGVVPDSGTNAGDLAAVTFSAGSDSGGPCKVVQGSANNTIRWSSCVAYSGGRRVKVSAQTSDIATGVSNGNFGWLCLTGSNNQPAMVGNGTETANQPSFSATAPTLCLAEIKGGATTVAAIYDVRTFTTSRKKLVNIVTTATTPGMIVSGNGTTTGQYLISTTAGDQVKLRGVVVATAGGTTANTMNAIIATSGPAFVKATAGTVNDLVESSTTAGYARTTATTTFTNYAYLGISEGTWASTCTNNTDTCRSSLLVDLALR